MTPQHTMETILSVRNWTDGCRDCQGFKGSPEHQYTVSSAPCTSSERARRTASFFFFLNAMLQYLFLYMATNGYPKLFFSSTDWHYVKVLASKYYRHHYFLHSRSGISVEEKRIKVIKVPHLRMLVWRIRLQVFVTATFVDLIPQSCTMP